MKRFSLFVLLFVLAVSILGVCQTTMTPLPNPTPALNSIAGEWNAGLCINNTGFFNTVHFSFNTAAKTMSITANGYPGTSSYNDFSKGPFVYAFQEANAYEGDSELTYTYSTTLPDSNSPALGNGGDNLLTTVGVIQLSANRYMGIYFRRNATQDKELFQGTIFAERSSDFTANGLSNLATDGRNLCNAIYNQPASAQGQAIRRWAKQ